MHRYKGTLRACFTGYIVQAVIGNFAPLLFLTFQREYAIPLSQITLLITVKNVYKRQHPHDETLKNLAALGCTVLRTDTDGTVAVVTDGERYTAHTWSAEEGLSPAA